MSMIPHIFGGSGRRSDVYDPFSLEIWDPFEGFPFRSLTDEIRPGFNFPFPQGTASFAGSNVDWRETPKAHVFKVDVPGLKKEEVKVEVEDGRILQISGKSIKEQEERTDTWHRMERTSGRFSRRFRLPENAKVEEVKAGMEDGVLTVTVPKEEAKKASFRSIDISG